MSDARFPAWLARSQAEYVADLVAAGEPDETAQLHAAQSLAHAFPGGAPSPGQAVFEVLDDSGQEVGSLWIGSDISDDAGSWWIWDIEVDEQRRGSGIGRAVMLLGEQYAREQGAHTLGLNVFGSNKAARGLYASLGYQEASVKMRKRLA